MGNHIIHTVMLWTTKYYTHTHTHSDTNYTHSVMLWATRYYTHTQWCHGQPCYTLTHSLMLWVTTYYAHTVTPWAIPLHTHTHSITFGFSWLNIFLTLCGLNKRNKQVSQQLGCNAMYKDLKQNPGHHMVPSHPALASHTSNTGWHSFLLSSFKSKLKTHLFSSTYGFVIFFLLIQLTHHQQHMYL